MLTEGQSKIIKSLGKRPRHIIYKCVKEIGVNIPNMYSMKKEQLVRSVATNEKGREILLKVRSHIKEQQEEKESKLKEAAGSDEPVEYVDDDDDEENDSSDSEIETHSKKKSKN